MIKNFLQVKSSKTTHKNKSMDAYDTISASYNEPLGIYFDKYYDF